MMWKILFVALFYCCVSSQPPPPPPYSPTANLASSWTNDVNGKPIILRVMHADMSNSSSLAYACGFYCISTTPTCNAYLFGIYILHMYEEGAPAHFMGSSSQLVWSANRNNAVGENATVELTEGGDLVLKDADGTLVWSSNTAGKLVAGLNLTEMGNMVLFDANNRVVWQSFDHPTDCLLVGQILHSGKNNLTSAASPTNWSAGLYSISMTSRGLVASIMSNPPQIYYEIPYSQIGTSSEHAYAEYRKGSLDLYANISVNSSSNPNETISTHSIKPQFIKLEANGHLQVYIWGKSWKAIFDIFTNIDFGDCFYPLACGKYGICLNGQCSCPKSSFRQINDTRPEFGCSQLNPPTCNASHNHTFLDLNHVTYFTLFDDTRLPSIVHFTNFKTCKDMCLEDCSCKAAMFLSNKNYTEGYCYLPTEIFSLMKIEEISVDMDYSVSIKVQIATTASPAKGKTSLLWPILGSTLGILCAVVLIVTAFSVHRRSQRKTEDVEDDYLDHVPGMPSRFSLQELAAATNNFSKKLGEGGFGSVYEGSLNDGTRIAVKRLKGVTHIKKSFLAEVEAIGSIHHINLVRLIGFCAEKSDRLMVFEYMCNGSLDQWIYYEATFEWNQRRKVILDVAKGLTYLHEECHQKIFHLDIKPQNILLDEHYNAKLADFGQSKLIHRNQSKVWTNMRGTPGYLAPEWLGSVITEKVDVYSFGVVILNIISGRRTFESWRPDEEQSLLDVFNKKCEDANWMDFLSENVKCDHVAEVENMMKISAWCLQIEYEKRPTMSMVIKVLEGVMEVPDIDYNSLIPPNVFGPAEASSPGQGVTPLLSSILSGPR